MIKNNRFIMSNAMVVANLLSVWGAYVFAFMLTKGMAQENLIPGEANWEFGYFDTLIYLSLFGGLTIWYELPVRRAIKRIYLHKKIHPKDLLKARQRLLNEPYVIIALDFAIWMGIDFIFTLYHIRAGDDFLTLILDGIDTFLTASITVTTAFFVLQFVLQKWLAPIFFPGGQLSSVPKTMKTRISKTLISLSLALSGIPLSIIIYIHMKFADMYNRGIDGEQVLQNLTPHVIKVSLIFICLGIFLTLIVSKNFSRSLMEITKVLRRVGKGKLDDKVRVSTNDEIGYTGDVINKMTEGLKERERLQQSINIAHEVQQLLLPQENPVVSGLDIAGKSIYCEETGGDYYDFLQLGSAEPAKTGVIVGDVSGHGIGSALFMSSARALLRLRSSQSDTLSEIVNDVNRELSNDFGDSGQFMTLFFLIIEHSTRSVRWVRAGHDPAILYNPQSDSFDELHGTGLPIGVDADWRYTEEEKQSLPKDQIIVIGTDGIWEAQNAEGEMFGKERVYEMIQQNAAESSSQILKCIVDKLSLFKKGYHSTDDVTLVVIKT